ncbi:hypothetical protein KJ762_07310 [bacterium]|nr:hypothetical protein [bacterium]MBU1634303.1 hypothetical protein [bacterium]MBU1874595.1 hypothetical protein [bacterium]
MKKTIIILLFSLLYMTCSSDKYPLPSIPDIDDRYANIGKQVYNLIYPILDAESGYAFNHPSDIYFGVDNFVYVCDTDNNRIVMLDAGGGLQGISQYIDHPEAISQDDSLNLLIVNKTNKVYKINLLKYNHFIADAPIELVYQQTSKPTRQFTGISVHNGFEYYVTVIDVADSNTNYLEFSFIYDFYRDKKDQYIHKLKGTIPLYMNGTGLFSAIIPTSVLSIREMYQDISGTKEDSRAFYFTQSGKTSLLFNSFKVQYISTVLFEGQEVLVPYTGFLGTHIYSPEYFWNPEDIAIDRQGFIFVVDAGMDSPPSDLTLYNPGFFRFSSSGTLLQTVVGFGTEPKKFNNPKGIAVSPFLDDQMVYIADTGNNRIMLFRLSTN